MNSPLYVLLIILGSSLVALFLMFIVATAWAVIRAFKDYDPKVKARKGTDEE